jgi:hypothetical protein
MSRDATLELFKAVRSALVADATIAGHVGTGANARISTEWGNVLASPYMRLSIPMVTRFEADGDSDEEADGSEYTLRVHVFVKEAGPILSAQLAALVRDVLQDANLTVDAADLWWLTYDQTVNVQDGDDPTLRMAVVTFKAATTS